MTAPHSSQTSLVSPTPTCVIEASVLCIACGASCRPSLASGERARRPRTPAAGVHSIGQPWLHPPCESESGGNRGLRRSAEKGVRARQMMPTAARGCPRRSGRSRPGCGPSAAHAHSTATSIGGAVGHHLVGPGGVPSARRGQRNGGVSGSGSPVSRSQFETYLTQGLSRGSRGRWALLPRFHKRRALSACRLR